MRTEEKSLPGTPPNEEEGFHQSLSTPGADSRAQCKAQQCHQREIVSSVTENYSQIHCILIAKMLAEAIFLLQ